MSTPAFLEWAAAGFGGELVPVCGPRHGCASPGKRPHLTGWQDVTITPPWIASWARSHVGNMGLRTRLFPAVDIDIEDRGIADACERVVLTTLGSTARRSRANTARRLLLFRLEGEPFDKQAIRFVEPGGQRAQVEILASGQQVVVAGVHHTGAVIEWLPVEPLADRLAPMSVRHRDELAAALRKRLAELGCAVEGMDPVVRRSVSYVTGRATTAGTRQTDQDRDIAELALKKLDPDLPYEEWFRVGMALHARWPDESGLALWDGWSSRGRKYPGTREIERHWASFSAGRGVGFGTLIAMARRAG